MSFERTKTPSVCLTDPKKLFDFYDKHMEKERNYSQEYKKAWKENLIKDWNRRKSSEQTHEQLS